MIKKFLALVLLAVVIFALSAACGDSPEEKGSVYFFNFKPEQDAAYQLIAAEYTALTGVPVRVVTAAGGTYDARLREELNKGDAPTVFQVNGPMGYADQKAYTADLSGTEIYKRLSNKSIAIRDGESVVAIPFVIEGYGIIVNTEIMERYFATEDAKATDMAEIVGFDKLKEVVEDMQSKREELGINGVFASTSLMPGQDWRWQTHLANVALYYEWKDANADLSDAAATREITFKYGDNFKQLFDLYLQNSTIPPMMTGFKSVEDSMREFALGQAAMVQNGNWSYSQITSVPGAVTDDEDIALLPLYIGVAGEETQGVCIGTENFFCINKKARDADRQASLDFLNWLFTSKEGKDHVVTNLGFIAPFDGFSGERPGDPLGEQVLEWDAKSDAENVPWNFTLFPSQKFKDDFGSDLLLYAQGQKDWSEVAEDMRAYWTRERAATE
jgi:raffinose/stachyose/melibiose transport system substrate-binding protein